MRITRPILKILSTVSRWIWRMAVAAIIVVAAVVSLGREMAPALHEHKAWLEANLTASIGKAVTMKEVSAHWEGLIPEIWAEQLSIGDAIQAEKVLMRVDLLKSAKSRALVFDTLIITRAAVDIPIDTSSEASPFNVRAYLEFLFGSADIHINDLSIVLSHGASESLNLHMGDLVVENHNDSHWLNTTVFITDVAVNKKITPIVLTTRFTGDASDIFNGKGRGYIDLGDTQNIPRLQRFIKTLGKNVPGLVIDPARSVAARFWFDWQKNRINWQSTLAIDELVFSGSSADAAVKKAPLSQHYKLGFKGQLAGRVLIDEGVSEDYLVYVPAEQEIVVNNHRYSLPVFGLRYRRENNSLDQVLLGEARDRQTFFIHVPSLQLEAIQQYIAPLAVQKLQDVVKALEPKGRLVNVSVSVPLQKWITGNKNLFQDLEFRARLQQVSVSSWKGVPALEYVDGYVQASIDEGFVELDSKNSFRMHYPAIYRSPMTYQQASGRVHWQIDPVTSYIYVGSRHLQLSGEDGLVNGSFWLNVPPPHSEYPPEMYLNVGLQHSHVRYRDKYLPGMLSESLLSWLKQGIKDGDISDSGFIYRGPLHPSDVMEHSFQYYTNIKHGELKFDTAWPALKDADAAILVDNGVVHANIRSARLFDLNVRNTSVDVASAAANEPPFVNIRGNLAGPANDGLRLLRETALRKTFGDVFDSWQLQHDIAAHIDVGFTLGTTHDKDYQEIQLHFDHNDFLQGDIQLPLDQLTGELHYSSTQGMSSPAMTALLWGKEQVITIKPVVDGDGLPDIAINMNGNVDPQHLAEWSHLPFLHFMKGEIAAGCDLAIAIDESKTNKEPMATLSLYSDLQGVAVDLPAPFKKATETTRPVAVTIDLWKERQRYRVEYADQASAVLEQARDHPLRGDVIVNKQASVNDDTLPEFLRVRGELDHAVFADWLPVIEQYTQFSQQDAAVMASGTHTTPTVGTTGYPVLDVAIRQLQMGGSAWEDVHLIADYHPVLQAAAGKMEDSYWNIAFKTPVTAGDYRYFDTRRLPELDLEHYFIKTETGTEIKTADADVPAAQKTPIDDDALPDPLVNMVPQDLPALKVHAKQVLYNDANLGEWNFITRPDKQGVALENLQANMPGLHVTGFEKTPGAHLYWQRDTTGHMETRVHGKVLLGDGEISPSLGLVSIVEAENSQLEGAVSWAGSPVMMSFRRMQGDVSISSRKGRFLNSTATTDAMRIINVFNFSTWARRLKLDFTDLYKKGISYDEVKTRVNLDRGKLIFTDPLVMDSPSSRFVMTGSLDSVANSINASMVVTLPVSNNATWIAALAAGLPVAVGVWAVSKIFQETIDNLSSISYTISGALDDPQIKFERLLPDREKDKPAAVTPVH